MNKVDKSKSEVPPYGVTEPKTLTLKNKTIYHGVRKIDRKNSKVPAYGETERNIQQEIEGFFSEREKGRQCTKPLKQSTGVTKVDRKNHNIPVYAVTERKFCEKGREGVCPSEK